MIVASLTASDLAAVVAAVVSLVAVVALTLVLSALVRTLRATRDELDAVRARTEPLLQSLGDAIATADNNLERVDDLIGSAEALASTVDSAARVGYLTVGKPVIKTVALAKGTTRAARRLRTPRAS